MPSYLWHRGRTASPRKRPASYEHKNKKKGTVRGSARRSTTHTTQTNKFIANSNFFSVSVKIFGDVTALYLMLKFTPMSNIYNVKSTLGYGIVVYLNRFDEL